MVDNDAGDTNVDVDALLAVDRDRLPVVDGGATRWTDVGVGVGIVDEDGFATCMDDGSPRVGHVTARSAICARGGILVNPIGDVVILVGAD